MGLDVVEITFQIRVNDFEEGLQFYTKLFRRDPDFVPHEDFAEWEIIPKCWLQVGKGEAAQRSGPMRLGVSDIHAERERIINEFQIPVGEIFTRDGVPVMWCTFQDPWGNLIGFFEEIKR